MTPSHRINIQTIKLKFMKTIAKLIMLTFVFVFITNIIEAQNVISSEVFTEGNYAGSDISDNGNYVTVTIHDVGNDGDYGLSKLLEKQTGGTYNVINTFDLLPGTSSNGYVTSTKTSVSNSGISYIDYKYDASGENVYDRLQKNLPDGTSVNVLEYTNDGVATMKVIDGDLYCIFGVGTNFDPGTLGNLPSNLGGGYHLMKISGSTDQYVWSNSLGSQFVWNSDVEIMQKPGDVDNLYVTYANGDFVKFDRASGNNLGIIKSGSDGDKYKFDEGGNLHRLITSEHKLIIYDVNDNYASILWQTDWSQANLWNYPMDNWRIVENRLYGLYGSKILHLDKKLIHGYISISDLGSYGTGSNTNWVNDDGSFSYVKGNNGATTIVTLFEEDENTNLIPTLSDSEADIVAVVDGQTYDGTNRNDAYHQGTLVFADGSLPSVGDTPNSNWVNASTGTHLMILFPIEIDSRSGDLMFRGVFRKDGTAEDDINIKVILKEESDVVLAVNDLKKENNISIYPNPANDVINISADFTVNKIEVFDVSGRLVFKTVGIAHSKTDNKTINISNIKSGIYFVKVYGKSGVFIKKITKY